MFINAKQCISEHWELFFSFLQWFSLWLSWRWCLVQGFVGIYLKESLQGCAGQWDAGWAGASLRDAQLALAWWVIGITVSSLLMLGIPRLSRHSFPEGGWSETWVWRAVALLHCTAHRIFSWVQSVKHHQFRITALHLSSLECCIISGVLDKERIFHVSSVAN